MKRTGIISLQLFICICLMYSPMLNAQGPQQMFYALNQNQYLLDMLPNANHSVAYSIRKLRAAYTGPAFKVRRSGGGGGSGSPEGDVYFDENGFVSTSSMITITKSGGGYSTTSKVVWSTFFASSSSNGFVVTWYDQSVNGNDATQLTNSAQPQVVSSGALITENGLPTLQFVGAHGSEYLGLNTAISLPNATLFGVCRVTSGSTTVGIAENGTYSYNLNTYSNTGFLGITHYTVADVPSTLSYSTSALNTYSWSKLSTNTFVEVNNRTAASTAARDIPIAISQVYGNALSGSTLRISEFIVTSYASTTVRSSVFESQRLVFKTL